MQVRLGGIDVGVTRSWLVAQAVGVLGLSLPAYSTVLGHLGLRLTPVSCLWVGLVLLGALNATVLVHEAGHTVAARIFGIRVQAVVLLAYGGATIRDTSPGGAIDRWTA